MKRDKPKEVINEIINGRIRHLIFGHTSVALVQSTERNSSLHLSWFPFFDPYSRNLNGLDFGNPGFLDPNGRDLYLQIRTCISDSIEQIFAEDLLLTLIRFLLTITIQLLYLLGISQYFLLNMEFKYTCVYIYLWSIIFTSQVPVAGRCSLVGALPSSAVAPSPRTECSRWEVSPTYRPRVRRRSTHVFPRYHPMHPSAGYSGSCPRWSSQFWSDTCRFKHHRLYI